MLQQKQVDALIRACGINVAEHPITIETNATQPIKLDPIYRTIHASCSPKLHSVSGEKDAINIGRLVEYMNFFETGALKFVVNGTKECWEELDGLLVSLVQHMKYPNWTLWAMPVGANIESQDQKHIESIVDAALKRGLHIATRNHVYVYGNRNGK